MAEGQTSLKKDFDDQLTCSVCLDQYTNPRVLPCLHSFCLKCIQRLPIELKDGKHYIDCPTCRLKHQIPEGGLVNLPNDFKINSLFELRKKLDTTQITPPINDTKCPQHNDPLKVYCETCSEVICHDCTISQHKGHKFFPISECYPKHLQEIKAGMDQIKQKITKLDKAVADLDTVERNVLQLGQDLEEKINTHAQKLIQKIQNSQEQLLEEVHTIVQLKTKTLSVQKKQAQKLHTELNICQQKIARNLKEWTQQKILINKQKMMDEMNKDTQHATSFQPIEKADIEFTKIDTFQNDIGHITSSTHKYGKATLKTSSLFYTGDASTVTLMVESIDDSPFSLPVSAISAKLYSSDTKDYKKCEVTEKYEGIFKIKITPLNRAQNTLIVHVGGIAVPDSPLKLPVKLHPEMRKPVNTMANGLDKPCGIAVCDNGDIVVAEYGAHRITILNKEGKKVTSFGTKGTENGQFTNPYGVAISIGGHILVTDNHRLQKLTTDGDYIGSVGSGVRGKRQEQFNTPKGLTVHPQTGNIYVADSRNNRIQVFTNDLEFSDTITHGHRLKHFKNPTDVSYDDGYLYIAEKGNQWTKQSIERRDLNKTFTYERPVYGKYSEASPPCTFLTVNNQIVYTVGLIRMKDVVVFTINGDYICYYSMESASGIAMDHLDNLYTANFHNGTITVFN